MLKFFTISDKLILLSALLSLIFSETLWFQGEKDSAIFVGIWVPSIISFGVYLKILKLKKND